MTALSIPVKKDSGLHFLNFSNGILVGFNSFRSPSNFDDWIVKHSALPFNLYSTDKAPHAFLHSFLISGLRIFSLAFFERHRSDRKGLQPSHLGWKSEEKAPGTVGRSRPGKIFPLLKNLLDGNVCKE